MPAIEINPVDTTVTIAGKNYAIQAIDITNTIDSIPYVGVLIGGNEISSQYGIGKPTLNKLSNYYTMLKKAASSLSPAVVTITTKTNTFKLDDLLITEAGLQASSSGEISISCTLRPSCIKMELTPALTKSLESSVDTKIMEICTNSSGVLEICTKIIRMFATEAEAQKTESIAGIDAVKIPESIYKKMDFDWMSYFNKDVFPCEEKLNIATNDGKNLLEASKLAVGFICQSSFGGSILDVFTRVLSIVDLHFSYDFFTKKIGVFSINPWEVTTVSVHSNEISQIRLPSGGQVKICGVTLEGDFETEDTNADPTNATSSKKKTEHVRIGYFPTELVTDGFVVSERIPEWVTTAYELLPAISAQEASDVKQSSPTSKSSNEKKSMTDYLEKFSSVLPDLLEHKFRASYNDGAGAECLISEKERFLTPGRICEILAASASFESGDESLKETGSSALFYGIVVSSTAHISVQSRSFDTSIQVSHCLTEEERNQLERQDPVYPTLYKVNE